MKKQWLSFVCLVLAAASGSAIDFTLSDSSMDWRDQMWLEMSISNIAVEGGVDLMLYVDIDGNGSVNGDDFLAAVFEVDDGETNRFGAQTFVDDNDGTINGVIETAVPMFGVSYNVPQTIGTYVWKAVEIDENEEPIATAMAPFAVTQPTGTVWVSGTVRDYFSHDPVTGAYVEMEYFSDAVGLPPATWTDENGEFILYLPDGVSTADVAFVMTVAPEMMSAEFNPDNGEPISGYAFTQALVPGENTVPDLYVVPESAEYELYRVNGTVYQVEPLDGGGYETNVLSGVMVECELDDDDDGPEVFSLDITELNGQFSLVIPGGDGDAERELWCESPLLNLRGLVGSWATVEVTGTVSGVEIYLQPADAMIRGRVEVKDSGEPLAGVEVFYEAESNRYFNSAFTQEEGIYEIGLLAGTYQGECEYDTLIPRSYLGPPQTNGLSLTHGTVLLNVNFLVERGYPLSGRVCDTNDNPLTDGFVALLQDKGWEHWAGDCDVRYDGYYLLLSPTGGVYVRTEEFGDYYVDQYHSNQTLCALSEVDPLEMTTNGLSGIDFHLAPGARLEGSVLRDGTTPVEWLRIDALVRNASNEWTCIGGGNTEWGGSFDFAVPAGEDVYLRTEVDYEGMAPRTWYGDTCSGDLAVSLAVSTETTASNLNIAVSSGYRANGEVREQNSPTWLAGAVVTAFDSLSNRYDTVMTDTNGHYDLYLPTNTPLAVYAGAAGYQAEFFENAYDPANAEPIEGMMAHGHVYVPFTLYATSTDSDGDGLPDYLEDSVPDGTFNAADDYSDPAVKDTDDDGVKDGDEYIAGTSAQDPSSLFQIVDGELTAEQAWISWASVAGRHYTVKFSEDLVSGTWSYVYSVTASGSLTSFTNALPADTGYLCVEVSAD